jgi:hypothetical protein
MGLVGTPRECEGGFAEGGEDGPDFVEVDAKTFDGLDSLLDGLNRDNKEQGKKEVWRRTAARAP